MSDGGTAYDEPEGGGGGLAAAETTGVCADVAAVDPFRFEAVTITRTVLPTREFERVVVEAVAPVIKLQLAPAESHRSHWKANFKPFPCHVPVLAVMVFGTTALPLIEGGAWFWGGCCPGAAAPPEAPPVASMRITAAPVRAVVMRRLITSLPSGGGRGPVTLRWGSRGRFLRFLVELISCFSKTNHLRQLAVRQQRPATATEASACARRANGYNRGITLRGQSQPGLVEGVRVPFVDLQPASSAVKDRVLARISQTLDEGDFLNGEAVGEFERRFAEFVGRIHCVGVSSGLDALRLALLGSGLQPGGEVIVPAATFAATYEAVVQAGGTPVVVDIAPEDYNLDVEQTETAAAAGASHIVPVHLYGQMADMRSLAHIAEKYGVEIVEDACQAHGALRDGVRAGGGGRAAAFSFYPSKNLGAMGDAGALVTDDEGLASHTRALRVHGETRKYHHEYVGYTARLDTIQAIVLLEKLPMLDDWNSQRRTAARFYSDALSRLDGLRLPAESPGSESAWHLYVVRTAAPERLVEFLAKRGVQAGRHYPEPVHLSPAYRHLGFGPGDFPVAEALAREGLSLPLYPGISQAQLEHVCAAITDYIGSE